MFAVGTAYVQVISTAARVETAKAQLTSADELDQQTANRVKNEVSPEIDSIRAQVERQSAEQRLTNASNQLEKDRLTLARIIGLAVDQDFVLTEALSYHPLPGMTTAIHVPKATPVIQLATSFAITGPRATATQVATVSDSP